MDSGFLGLGVENYRGFRYNWTGLPNETPAIASLKNNEGTTVYVSWNGDTETKIWRFYQVTDEYGSREYLGENKRTGFETSLFLKGRTIHIVSAESINANGRVLTSTGIAKTKAEVLPPNKGSDLSKSGSFHSDVQFNVQSGQVSRWEEHMMLKVDRFHLD
jgi:hypothetical protein